MIGRQLQSRCHNRNLRLYIAASGQVLMQNLNRHLYVLDNIRLLRGLDSDSIDLICSDPPYNSKRVFNAPLGSKAAGQKFDDRWRWDEVTDEWHDLLSIEYPAVKEVIEAAAVIEGGSVDRRSGRISTGRVKNSMAAYLAWMAPRLIEMKRVLKGTGSIYIHCDDSAESYLRLLMDGIFGRAQFRNAITWKRTTGRSGANRYGRVSDRLLFYCLDRPVWNTQYEPHNPEYIKKFYRHEDEHGRWRSDQLTASGLSRGDSGQSWRGIDPSVHGNHWRGPNAFPSHITKPEDWDDLSTRQKLDCLDDLGLIVWPQKGSVPCFKRYLSTTKGNAATDIITDVLPVQTHSSERTGWSTQKPVALYERLIKASSNPGDIVLDPFCGCSTTLVAAERLGRQWIGCDIDPRAQEVVQDQMCKLLLDESALPFQQGQGFKHSKTPPKRTDIKTYSKQETKNLVFHRQSAQCGNRYCTSDALRLVDMELDHRLPKSRGGSDDIDNMTGLCGNCNRRKGAKSWGEFLAQEAADRAREEIRVNR